MWLLNSDARNERLHPEGCRRTIAIDHKTPEAGSASVVFGLSLSIQRLFSHPPYINLARPDKRSRAVQRCSRPESVNRLATPKFAGGMREMTAAP